jgi:lipooligosaccharide transport system permease protein
MVAIRLCIVASIFTFVIVLFGAAGSGRILLAIPAAVLTGLAFAAPITAFSATQRDTQWFNALFRFGITPLFLFSGTFFPVDQLPAILQPIAWVTPLFHGVALTRGLSLGVAGEADRDGRAHRLPVTLTVVGAYAATVQFGSAGALTMTPTVRIAPPIGMGAAAHGS